MDIMLYIILGIFFVGTLIYLFFYIRKNSVETIHQIRERKKLLAQVHVTAIEEIHARMIGAAGKKPNLFEKKGVLEKLRENINGYNVYVDFCRDNNLDLAEDEIQVVDMMYETEDLLDPHKALDRALERAGKEYEFEHAKMNAVGENLYQKRNETLAVIEDIENLINSIAQSPKEIQAQVSEIEVHKEEYRSAKEFAMEQKKDLEREIAAGGVGVAAGAAVASMAPTAMMWVATTFGTASTGTAISALGGAAATNAALAWLGGGAIAASGGGMAAGQALLALAGPVGWGVAGVSVLATVVLAWRKMIKREEGKKEEITRIKNSAHSIKLLTTKMITMASKTMKLNEEISEQYKRCMKFRGKDYRSIKESDRRLLGALINNTNAAAKLVSSTIEEGE